MLETPNRSGEFRQQRPLYRQQQAVKPGQKLLPDVADRADVSVDRCLLKASAVHHQPLSCGAANDDVLPIVGMVVTISPSFSLYRMVVFPAASSPTETSNSTFGR